MGLWIVVLSNRYFVRYFWTAHVGLVVGQDWKKIYHDLYCCVCDANCYILDGRSRYLRHREVCGKKCLHGIQESMSIGDFVILRICRIINFVNFIQQQLCFIILSREKSFPECKSNNQPLQMTRLQFQPYNNILS